MPEAAHKDFNKALHPRQGNFYSRIRNGGRAVGGRLLGTAAFLISVSSILLDSPQSPVYLFLRPGEGSPNRAYIEPFSGQVYEWNFHSEWGDDTREVRYYEDYDKIDGEWRGVGFQGSELYDKNGDKLIIY